MMDWRDMGEMCHDTIQKLACWVENMHALSKRSFGYPETLEKIRENWRKFYRNK